MSIYAPQTDGDGLRVLVMRYWPRGVKKDRVDLWLRDLGPSTGLIKRWKAEEIGWAAFKSEYKAQFKDEAWQKAYEELQEAIKKTKACPITLLCSCADERRCHRHILKEILEKD